MVNENYDKIISVLQSYEDYMIENFMNKYKVYRRGLLSPQSKEFDTEQEAYDYIFGMIAADILKELNL